MTEDSVTFALRWLPGLMRFHGESTALPRIESRLVKPARLGQIFEQAAAQPANVDPNGFPGTWQIVRDVRKFFAVFTPV